MLTREAWRPPVTLEWPWGVEAPFSSVLDQARRSALVALGEEHATPWIVRSGAEILLSMASGPGKLALAMEMFNVEQQSLLDAWLLGELSWDELVEEYSRGPEGFPLDVYRPLMEAAKSLGARIFGVMPPRTKANMVARTGRLPRDAGPIALPEAWPHYSGALAKLFPRSGPMARIPVERLLLAQSYKDHIASTVVAKLLRDGFRILLLMGWAHVEVPGSVPDRAAALASLPEEPLIVGARRRGLHDYLSSGEHLSLRLRSKYTLIGGEGKP